MNLGLTASRTAISILFALYFYMGCAPLLKPPASVTRAGGQLNYFATSIFGALSGTTADSYFGSYWAPDAAFYDSSSGKFFLSQARLHKVLIWNTPPTSTATAPDLVLGQPENMSFSNSATLSSKNFGWIRGLATDGTRLAIADSDNNRVLIWNTFPTSNYQAADHVLGQTSFTANTSNSGGLSGSSLNGPRSVWIQGGKLVVADSGNNRVLIWNTFPTSDNAVADVVLGQSLMTTSAAACTSTGLSSPRSVWYGGGNLYVSDYSQNRVLAFAGIPGASGTAAAYAIGQPNRTTCTCATSASKLCNPGTGTVAGTKLIVPSLTQHRLLIWDTLPVADNSSADHVVGQSNMTNSSSDQARVTGSGTVDIQGDAMNNPTSVAVTSSNVLYAVDTNNQRILIYNTIPVTDGVTASSVLGQPNLTSNLANNSGLINQGQPGWGYGGPFWDGSRLFISDAVNSRVLIWNSYPYSQYTAPDVILGQNSIANSNANNGGSVTAKVMAFPSVRPASDGTNLVVSDQLNNRVMLFSASVGVNFTATSVVLGQPNKTSGGWNNPSVSLGMGGPGAPAISGGKIFVPEFGNSRVLIWNSIPGADGTAADVALGQTSLATNTCNLGGFVTAQTLCSTGSAWVYGTKLLVVDGNNRVLIWNTIPTAHGQAADVVIGQPDMTSNTANNGGISARTLSGPHSVAVMNNGVLAISDPGNHRVLIWNSIPTTNFAPADRVLGQPDFTSNTANYGGRSSGSLSNPGALAAKGNDLIVWDIDNARMLLFQNP